MNDVTLDELLDKVTAIVARKLVLHLEQSSKTTIPVARTHEMTAYSTRARGSKDLSHYSAVIALENEVRTLADTEVVIHHSDRGCQYCCHEYLAFLKGHGIMSSMTDADHCDQNAIAERVNGILKDEFNLDAIFRNFEQLRAAVTHPVLVYNTKRTHWSLDLLTPLEKYEQAA